MTDNPLNLFIVGTNKTGKSTYAAKIAAKFPRVLWFGLVLPGNLTGDVLHIKPSSDPDRNKKAMSRSLVKFGSGLVVIDDLRVWIGGNFRVSFVVSKMMAERRHRRQAFVFCAHDVNDIPSDCLQYDPLILVKRTTRNPTKAKLAQFNNPDALLSLVNRVNNEAVKNPYIGYIYCDT